MPLFRFAITSETVFGGEDEVSARVKVVTEGGVSGEGVSCEPHSPGGNRTIATVQLTSMLHYANSSGCESADFFEQFFCLPDKLR